jgi:hypothetical protein
MHRRSAVTCYRQKILLGSKNLLVKNYFVKGCSYGKSGPIGNLKEFIAVTRFVLKRLSSYWMFKILCAY